MHSVIAKYVNFIWNINLVSSEMTSVMLRFWKIEFHNNRSIHRTVINRSILKIQKEEEEEKKTRTMNILRNDRCVN